MGYAQHVRSPRLGAYYLARYKQADGTYGTVKDPLGKSVHYERKRDAEKAARDAEADVRAGRIEEAAAEPGALTFGDWANAWYASLNLAPSTMANYREHLELHILPAFQDSLLRPRLEILPPHVEAWKQRLRGDGYKDSTIGTFLGTFRSCLGYASAAAVIDSNPAAAEAGPMQGKRGIARAAAGRAAAEKVITTVLGGLLLAERMSILSGRDAEFTLTVLLQHAALRLGEGIGLEARYAGPGAVRVEWQLSQVGPRLIRAIPKDGSRGDVVIAPFLGDLLGWQAGHQPPVPCECHGLAYLFTGPGGRKARPLAGVTVRDVAAAAGVTAEAVWAALDDDARLPQAARARVRAAAKDLGWQAGSAPLDAGWHWRHSALERLLAAAASGWWPAAGKASPEHPVWLAGEWPGGELVRYRPGRAGWCWLPLARGLTPHGLRHSLRTWMEETGIPHVLAEAQLRHEQGGIDVYRHVTEGMRAQYRGKLQEAWEQALQRRGEMHPGSPVRVVDALLREASDGFAARNSQGATVTALRVRR